MKRILKFIFKLFIILIIIVALLFGASKVFEKAIVNKAIQAINTQLNVPIAVQRINLSFLSHFPYATIELYNVVVESSKGINKSEFDKAYSSHLMVLKRVSLSFNIMSIRSEALELTKIELSKGEINLLVDKQGVNNYSIFKTSSKTAATTDLQILLKLLTFKDINFRVVNVYKESHLHVFAHNFQLSGKLYNKKYEAQTKGQLMLKKYSNHQMVLIPKNSTTLKLNLGIDNRTIKIINGGFSTQGIEFNIDGIITLEDSYTDLNINVQGNHISIATLLELIPDKSFKINDISADGELEIDTKIMGKISDKLSPNIQSKFRISNGLISHAKSGTKVKQLELNGVFNNLANPVLSIPNFAFSTDSSSLKGTFSLSSFQNPIISLNTKFGINTNDINHLFKIEGVDSFSGFFEGELSSRGKWPNEFSLSSVSDFANKGTAKIENFNIKLKDSPVHLKGVSGRVSLLADEITLVDVKGYFMDIQAGCNGKITNLISSLNKPYEQVNIVGNAYFNKVVYSHIETLFADSDKPSENKTNYNIKAGLLIKELEYQGFMAENVSGDLIYQNEQLTINNLNLYAFGGNIKSSIQLLPSASNSKIFKTKTSTTNIEISEVFTAFINFNQTFITADNIKGRVTSNIEGEILLTNNKFLPQTLDLLGHIKIVNGELINFEPALALSSFCEIGELKHLKFETLENDIMISDGVIHIPQMDIASNALDISLFGQQQLNGAFEYHIKMLLSDLLGNKRKKLKQQQSQFGTIQDDGLGRTSIYLVAVGVNGETKIKYDKNELGKHLKSEMANEKKELKQILNEEFGWFSKDSVANTKKPEPKPQFQIEWDSE